MNKKCIVSLAIPLFCVSAVSQAVEMTASGQINRAVMTTDNGEKTETYFVDNTNSSTRFRFSATGQITDTR